MSPERDIFLTFSPPLLYANAVRCGCVGSRAPSDSSGSEAPLDDFLKRSDPLPLIPAQPQAYNT